MRLFPSLIVAVVASSCVSVNTASESGPTDNDRAWLLPAQSPYPESNAPTAARLELGKMLFFDPRLSGDGNMSCASCHIPSFGWSDGLPKAKGFHSQVLLRNTPTIINTGYNSVQMWDGRKKTLEDQVMGPMETKTIMNMDVPKLFKWLNEDEMYRQKFEKAYPGEKIDSATLSKAIAVYERSIVSNNSPFDRWLRGDKQAMTPQQVKGFRLFTNSDKGNCSACHQAPNFTDNGFHNLGLASWGSEKPDVGRFAQKPVPLMKGAFKTPTLRDVDQTAPYFHDGSAKTLMEVVEHYSKGGVVTTNLSPNMKPLNLSRDEKEAIVAFLHALTSPAEPVTFPVLPPN